MWLYSLGTTFIYSAKHCTRGLHNDNDRWASCENLCNAVKGRGWKKKKSCKHCELLTISMIMYMSAEDIDRCCGYLHPRRRRSCSHVTNGCVQPPAHTPPTCSGRKKRVWTWTLPPWCPRSLCCWKSCTAQAGTCTANVEIKVDFHYDMPLIDILWKQARNDYKNRSRVVGMAEIRHVSTLGKGKNLSSRSQIN